MKAEKTMYCVLHEQDEFLKVEHHHKILGFPFSQYSCPRETELVVSLIKALLSQYGTPKSPGYILARNKVYTYTSQYHLSNPIPLGYKVLEIWGTYSVDEQYYIQSLSV